MDILFRKDIGDLYILTQGSYPALFRIHDMWLAAGSVTAGCNSYLHGVSIKRLHQKEQVGLVREWPEAMEQNGCIEVCLLAEFRIMLSQRQTVEAVLGHKSRSLTPPSVLHGEI